jgi:transcriptional regulator with XRE-family HTH domain
MIIADGVGSRLREERERLGLNQTDFGERVSVSRGTQKAYELGTSSPDLRYVAALEKNGVDTRYVLSGVRSQRLDEGLSVGEEKVIYDYRALPDEDKACVRRLTTALAQSSGNDVRKA